MKTPGDIEPDEPLAAIREKVILVIDDDVAILVMVKKILEREGFRVEVAESSKEGITKYRRFRPALILLDVDLPTTNGFEVCAQIKRLSLSEDDIQAFLRHRSIAKPSHVSIVFISSRSSEDDIRRATEAGGDGYIAKPFTSEMLLTKVYYYLDKAAQPPSQYP